MTGLARTEAEFTARSWSPDDWTHLDYGWTFDLALDRLVLLPRHLTGSDTRQPPVSRINAFAGAAVDAMIAIESFAQWVAKESDGPTSYHYQEETRHLLALTQYRSRRWGSVPWRAPDVLSELSAISLQDNTLPAQVLGAAVIEPLAQSLACFFHCRAADPLLVRLCAFIISDEMAHDPAREAPACEPQDLADGDRMLIGQLASAIVAALVGDCTGHVRTVDDAQVARLPLAYCANIAERLDRYDVPRESLTPLLTSLGLDGQDAGELCRQIAADSAKFLSQLRTADDFIPPAGLSIEWMVAGLRWMNRFLH